jgi:hypothetical protein
MKHKTGERQVTEKGQKDETSQGRSENVDGIKQAAYYGGDGFSGEDYDKLIAHFRLCEQRTVEHKYGRRLYYGPLYRSRDRNRTRL